MVVGGDNDDMLKETPVGTIPVFQCLKLFFWGKIAGVYKPFNKSHILEVLLFIRPNCIW